MRRRRVASWVTGGVLLLAACGSPSTNEPAVQPAPTAATDAPAAADQAEPDGAAATAATTPTDDTAASVTAEPATTDSATTAEPTGDPVEETTAATEPPATAAPVSEALDAGCSVDNTATDAAAGPVPALDVRAESLASPLPDLAVRQINCAGGWVNLKNALPNDKPLLVWFWAPH